MTRRYWCEHAWLGGPGVERGVEHGVVVEVAGDRIASVHVGVDRPPADTRRLDGLTIPGLANAHSHAFHRALRGRTHDGRGTFWTWRDRMYRIAEQLDPDSYHELACAVFGEMALAGITCVGEFHYVHHQRDGTPYTDPNALGAALVAAAQHAGIRITLLDTCYLHGGMRPDGGTIELDEVQRRFTDGDAERWAERVDAIGATLGPDARLGAAVHSVRAVDPASISTVADYAAEHDLVLHAHVSEQPAENQACLAAHGRTPVELLDDHGALTARSTAVHGNHLSDTDIARLGAARTTVCCCPTTERDLADGIAPTVRLVEAGASLSMGSDSHAVIDLFEELRAVETHERLATLSRGNHAADALLAAATVHGHASLGWTDAGVIAVGARADLVTLRLDSVRTAGCPPTPATVVFAASAADVAHVVASGAEVVRDGHHVRMDVAADLARTIDRITSRAGEVRR
jgi:formiminoglutamate deiminase